MIAVIFEVEPLPGQRDAYLAAAASLRDDLASIDGFLSIERFQSLAAPSRMLSLSFWRDEEAVRQWRTLPSHRATQALGRTALFAGYRLRVAHVLRDYGMHEREQGPADARAAHG